MQEQTTGGSTAQIWTLEAKEAKLNMTHTGQETIKIKEEVTDTGHDQGRHEQTRNEEL